MDTLLLPIWLAAAAATAVAARLHILVKARLGIGHWLVTLVALGCTGMVLSWPLTLLLFDHDGWLSPAAWIVATVYVALAIMTVVAIGPKGDATPLLKRFPATVLPASAASTRSNDQSEIEL